MKKMLLLLIPMFSLLVATATLYAQNSTMKMDSAFNAQSANDFLMGNLLIAEKGNIVARRSFGYQDIAAKKPNTPASEFALASISKQFTSVAILQLKEKGKLSLDDHFVKYFPDFPFPQITIRQLLTHTSGLPDYELFDTLINRQPNRIFSNKDIIPALKTWHKVLYFQPGDNWQYSNMNYCLLALLVEKRSGQAFPLYLSKNIFKPAGLQHTYLENLLFNKPNPERTVNYEYPHYYDPGPVQVDAIADDHQMQFNLGGFYGQGGLTTTAEDLLRFDNAFFAGKLISLADIQLALTPVKLNSGKMAQSKGAFGDLGAAGYGMGWMILNDSTKGKIVFHDGGRPGISTIHLHNMRTDQTVIMLENLPERSSEWAVWAYHLLNGETVRSPGIPLIYTYASTLVKAGADAAAVALQSLRDNPAYQMPSEKAWVDFGYQLFGKKEYMPLAAEAMKTASLCQPDSWYVSQAYAAALELAGKKELAILMYRKSVAKNPKADYAVAKLKALETR